MTSKNRVDLTITDGQWGGPASNVPADPLRRQPMAMAQTECWELGGHGDSANLGELWVNNGQ